MNIKNQKRDGVQFVFYRLKPGFRGIFFEGILLLRVGIRVRAFDAALQNSFWKSLNATTCLKNTLYLRITTQYQRWMDLPKSILDD